MPWWMNLMNSCNVHMVNTKWVVLDEHGYNVAFDQCVHSTDEIEQHFKSIKWVGGAYDAKLAIIVVLLAQASLVFNRSFVFIMLYFSSVLGELPDGPDSTPSSASFTDQQDCWAVNLTFLQTADCPLQVLRQLDIGHIDSPGVTSHWKPTHCLC